MLAWAWLHSHLSTVPFITVYSSWIKELILLIWILYSIKLLSFSTMIFTFIYLSIALMPHSLQENSPREWPQQNSFHLSLSICWNPCPICFSPKSYQIYSSTYQNSFNRKCQNLFCPYSLHEFWHLANNISQQLFLLILLCLTQTALLPSHLFLKLNSSFKLLLIIHCGWFEDNSFHTSTLCLHFASLLECIWSWFNPSYCWQKLWFCTCSLPGQTSQLAEEFTLQG